MSKNQINLIKQHIGCYPDFPKPGIIFRDIFSILQKPDVFCTLKEVLVQKAQSIEPKINSIVGLDSRGFLLGPLISLELNIPFVPIRKKGKLPGSVHAVSYELEYGEDTLEIQENSVTKGQNILIVDDLIATGGSLEASYRLLKSVGANVVAALVVIELEDLNGRAKLPCPVHSIVQF